MLVLVDVAKVEVHSMEGTALRTPRMGEAGKPLKLFSQHLPSRPPSFSMSPALPINRISYRQLPKSPIQCPMGLDWLFPVLEIGFLLTATP